MKKYSVLFRAFSEKGNERNYVPHKTPTLEERRALARRHVEAGRLIIIHQRQMVDRHKAEGRDTKAAEELLAVLERTQKAFERDLADLEKRRLP